MLLFVLPQLINTQNKMKEMYNLMDSVSQWIDDTQELMKEHNEDMAPEQQESIKKKAEVDWRLHNGKINTKLGTLLHLFAFFKDCPFALFVISALYFHLLTKKINKLKLEKFSGPLFYAF